MAGQSECNGLRSRNHRIASPSSLDASRVSSGRQSKNKKKPKLIIFDLDGCLWAPEMYELLYFSGGKGAPFTPDPTNPHRLRTVGGESVRLLGDVRRIMFELQYDEMWWNTRVGISSRTDQPVWARELLDKFVIDDSEDASSLPAFPLRQVFTPELCELAKDDKREHFERILVNAPGNLKFTDCLFFDNELGNCQAVARLGVTVCYCPRGVTREAWELAVDKFPSSNGKVIKSR
eukprot:CAMPEP_0172514708 /NCGR_PEP_ID=MMETSP1066-20121228/262159_1 /TAXON_ID=671091 /ORGANISM="Coscinodiscus wailesii, Strain CCMP2513" /LENGTH=233 /DNA_ID=CAMNT_0013295481 /DNA_START=204 /DNA_END=902 /DNA_ORIENTATION=-